VAEGLLVSVFVKGALEALPLGVREVLVAVAVQVHPQQLDRRAVLAEGGVERRASCSSRNSSRTISIVGADVVGIGARYAGDRTVKRRSAARPSEGPASERAQVLHLAELLPGQGRIQVGVAVHQEVALPHGVL
jgi:hypothetical protein